MVKNIIKIKNSRHTKLKFKINPASPNKNLNTFITTLPTMTRSERNRLLEINRQKKCAYMLIRTTCSAFVCEISLGRMLFHVLRYYFQIL